MYKTVAIISPGSLKPLISIHISFSLSIATWDKKLSGNMKGLGEIYKAIMYEIGDHKFKQEKIRVSIESSWWKSMEIRHKVDIEGVTMENNIFIQELIP